MRASHRPNAARSLADGRGNCPLSCSAGSAHGIEVFSGAGAGYIARGVADLAAPWARARQSGGSERVRERATSRCPAGGALCDAPDRRPRRGLGCRPSRGDGRAVVARAAAARTLADGSHGSDQAPSETRSWLRSLAPACERARTLATLRMRRWTRALTHTDGCADGRPPCADQQRPRDCPTLQAFCGTAAGHYRSGVTAETPGFTWTSRTNWLSRAGDGRRAQSSRSFQPFAAPVLRSSHYRR